MVKFNEHEYVDRYPKMYEKMNKRNKPSEKRSMNTVASQLKMLQTFMNELENQIVKLCLPCP